ncbi:MAG: hypothetical protein PHU06_11530 [Gallionella sp.]|nr:hypothetical protein [Gallionella sp.]MDD4959922.1 hypothetical protein [Gallionella sp.]
MDNKSLSAQYSDVLKNLDSSYLDPQHPISKRSEGLSGLFLTSVSDKYHLAKNKIMIVGSETAGWNVLKPNERYTTLESYIEISMNKHQIFFEKKLNRKNERGDRFHNFTRSVANKCGKDGLIYSNLFCFDWNEGSPIQSHHFEVIKKYSEELLKIQIEILKPQIIIFANGITSVTHRREFFPINGDNQACTNGRDYSSEGITNHHLWEFDLHKNIRCFRIHHPSTRTKDAAKARQFLINLLPSA